MTGGAGNEDECPIYWDPDTGYIFPPHREAFGEDEVMAAYRVSAQRQPGKVARATTRGPHGGATAVQPHTYQAADGVVCMQDQEVVMRDGTKIYCDIYKPEAEGRYPTIVSWSWFGKRPGDGKSEWQIMGVPPATVSKCAKFESPDPLFWCYKGYVVANVDVRGAGHSEGSVHMFTHQDREDGYDFVEWVAAQPWSNGRVGMSNAPAHAPVVHLPACPPPLAALRPGSARPTSTARASSRVAFRPSRSTSSSQRR